MEHREQRRKNLFLYLDVFDRETGRLLGHLGDISDEGLMIIADHAMPLNVLRKLRIRLPEDEDFDQDHLDAEVETRWTAPDINPELHCTGCLFIEISNADLERVEKVSQLLSFDG
ncbi:PilZ domain-containing protein [Candidatus Venteria ishoeyi]|uniref:PilZ domain-containing protein n=1 Tax=Candidatus Venteria ishoeyi TaxID=1899563 RepID=A0A1H6FE22_9GAMM|nr:PilZ domain-containing protein [Candidatus Venteria ishoeyi]MDM8545502.1 PilZ domain-containing protein [Candidatus Venteria ishoeyi]SEH07589.1 Uncharacterised protein [Candidatus Venteria ishoeyi]